MLHAISYDRILYLITQKKVCRVRYSFTIYFEILFRQSHEYNSSQRVKLMEFQQHDTFLYEYFLYKIVIHKFTFYLCA